MVTFWENTKNIFRCVLQRKNPENQQKSGIGSKNLELVKKESQSIPTFALPLAKGLHEHVL